MLWLGMVSVDVAGMGGFVSLGDYIYFWDCYDGPRVAEKSFIYICSDGSFNLCLLEKGRETEMEMARNFARKNPEGKKKNSSEISSWK
jgi:hypothetical protein